MVWPSRRWRYRLIIPGVLFAVLGASLWRWVNSTSGAIFAAIGLAWVVWEVALGPTAGSRIRATGVSIDLPLVKRTRRARKVLEAIDAAVRGSRDMTIPAAVPMSSLPSAGVFFPANPEAAPPSSADPSHE